ncbi:unnamed protein product, partial [marine sediment metagenome]
QFIPDSWGEEAEPIDLSWQDLEVNLPSDYRFNMPSVLDGKLWPSRWDELVREFPGLEFKPDTDWDRDHYVLGWFSVGSCKLRLGLIQGHEQGNYEYIHRHLHDATKRAEEKQIRFTDDTLHIKCTDDYIGLVQADATICLDASSLNP